MLKKVKILFSGKSEFSKNQRHLINYFVIIINWKEIHFKNFLVITKETNLEQKNFLIDLEFIINIKNQ